MSTQTPFSEGDLLVGMTVGMLILLFGAIIACRSSEPKVLFAALVMKLSSSFIYCMTLVFLYGGGDSLSYHSHGVEIAEEFRTDFGRGLQAFLNNDQFLLASGSSTSRIFSLSGLAHFLLMDSFIASSFAFALIGLTGQLLLYATFVDLYPDPRVRNWWRVGILFLPSFTFWSSGLLKDPLGILGLGCVMWGGHCILNRSRIRYGGLIAFGIYSIVMFRLQILPVLMAAIIPWLLSRPNQRSLVNRYRSLRVLYSVPIRLGLIAGSIVCLYLLPNLEPRYSLSEMPGRLQHQNSLYHGKDANVVIAFERSWLGALLAIPQAFILTLYRPFPWEARGVLQLVASAENMMIVAVSIRLVFQLIGRPMLLVLPLKSPFLLCCLIFVFAFTLAIGLSTPNMGSISRYRIPLIPFLVALPAIAESHSLQFQASRLARRRVAPAGPGHRPFQI